MLELLQFILEKPSRFFGTLILISILGIITLEFVADICRTIYAIKSDKCKENIVKHAIDSKDTEIIKSIMSE